jgi:hypothetical protein
VREARRARAEEKRLERFKPLNGLTTTVTPASIRDLALSTIRRRSVRAPKEGFGPLRTILNLASQASGLQLGDLAVLSKQVDPRDTPENRKIGQWFAEHVNALVDPLKNIHLRGSHYLISSTGKIFMPTGMQGKQSGLSGKLYIKCADLPSTPLKRHPEDHPDESKRGQHTDARAQKWIATRSEENRPN